MQIIYNNDDSYSTLNVNNLDWMVNWDVAWWLSQSDWLFASRISKSFSSTSKNEKIRTIQWSNKIKSINNSNIAFKVWADQDLNLFRENIKKWHIPNKDVITYNWVF